MQYRNLFSFVLSIVAVSPAMAQTAQPKSGMLAYPASGRIEAPAPKAADTPKTGHTTLSVLPGLTARTDAKPATAPETKPAATVPNTATETPGKLLAANVGAGNNAKGYSRVPLAGEKAYFGEKNEYVNDFVRKYLELHNKSLGSVQKNSEKPFNVIDNVLEKKSLPKELKYLAVIESALNHKAVSRAGAVGPWQLMASTARMMGLTVNRKHDERTDWNKSTAAATQYLELLYSQLNDWLLVIAAYNSGPTPVQKAIDRTGSRSFWDIKEYLPRETQGHVLAFIATASIFENLSKFINLGTVPMDFKFGKEDDAPPPVPKAVAAKPAAGVTATSPTTGGVNAAVIASNAVNATAAATHTAPAAGAHAAAAPVVKKATVFTEDELKNMTIVRLTEPVHFEIMNLELGIDPKLLARWNSDYELFVNKTYTTPHYNFRMPKDKLDAFMQKKDAIIKRSKLAFLSK